MTAGNQAYFIMRGQSTHTVQVKHYICNTEMESAFQDVLGFVYGKSF